MRHRIRSAGLAALAACAGIACQEETAREQVPERAVVVSPVRVVDFEERIEASGEILAKHRAEVAAQVAGVVTDALVDEGEAVAEYEIVLEIDPEKRHLDLARARARVGEAQAAVAEQERELGRVRALAERDIASETRLDSVTTALETARSRLRAAQAELGTAQRALRDATVRARFAGYVDRRYVSVGEYVAPGTKLFELVSLDPVEVEFHLPEAEASRVRVGLPIEVTVAPYPDRVFDARVHVVAPTIDPRTRTLRVKALIPNAGGDLQPGLFARTHLGIARREGVLTVPESAVLQRAGGPVVFRLAPGSRVERRPVETGVLRDGWVEIVEGLEAGDSVVSRGHADLADGSAVVPRHPDGTPVAPRLAAGDGGGGGQ